MTANRADTGYAGKEKVKMILTTLCYIKKDNQYLMLHRIKKQADPSAGKWIGVGGKFEEKESPDECLLREVKEETGLRLLSYHFHGVVTFISDQWETEQMFLYSADKFDGQLILCDEGELKWVETDKLNELNLWEGDKIFLDLLIKNVQHFSMKICYEGDNLVEKIVDICE